MNIYRGKIGRLTANLREQLNQRLAEGALSHHGSARLTGELRPAPVPPPPGWPNQVKNQVETRLNSQETRLNQPIRACVFSLAFGRRGGASDKEFGQDLQDNEVKCHHEPPGRDWANSSSAWRRVASVWPPSIRASSVTRSRGASRAISEMVRPSRTCLVTT